MKFLIHTCPKRKWYVDEFLVPSMIAQGIDENDIFIFNDDVGYGNLMAMIKSLTYYGQFFDDDEEVWHLQDDVLLSSFFYEKCKKYSGDEVIFGYCGNCEPEKAKYKRPKCKDQMWWSQPCMKLYAWMMSAISDYFYFELPKSRKYLLYHHLRKCDDVIVQDWLDLNMKKKGFDILQVSPSMVEHVDYLIGGSIVNTSRINKAISMDFDEPHLVKDLEDAIKKRNERKESK